MKLFKVFKKRKLYGREYSIPTAGLFYDKVDKPDIECKEVDIQQKTVFSGMLDIDEDLFAIIGGVSLTDFLRDSCGVNVLVTVEILDRHGNPYR